MASSSSSSSPEISHSAPAFDPSFFSYASLDDVLEELSTRFIMNLPDQELESVERMCFQVEQAHWYYEDFMREANPKLPSLSLKKFSSIFFTSCPLLRQWSAEHEQYFNTFMHYKVRVPVCGAIMLNDKWDKCILVKGWKSSAGWGFPKGKINQNEPAHECAAREVAEETGFNISSYIRSEDYIEMTIREQRVTLFIVGGIPEDYPFQTRTRKEISKIEWFKLSDLPSWKRNKQVPGKFYLISPFVHALKEFIRMNKTARRRQNRRKNGNGSTTGLTTQTDLEGDDVPGEDEHCKQHSIRAVSLDRDAHGYSSSSVDNGEPQTPSPQSIEALPIAMELNAEGKPDLPMDPHFARLLDGLTLSASKPTLNGETELRPVSTTPTSAESSLVSATEEEARSQINSSVSGFDDTRSSPMQSHVSADPLSLSNAKSPSESSRSDSSVMTMRPQSAQPMSSAPILPSASDRHLKHLALLESVAQELAASSPAPASRQPVHPGPPLSVPPMVSAPEDALNRLCGDRQSNGVHNLPPFHVEPRFAPPTPYDPFTVRPMTSQALFPPPPSIRRHGPMTNMHQGSLLSILSGSNGLSTVGPGPYHPMRQLGGIGGQGTLPYAGGFVQQPSFVQPSRTQEFATQSLRILPPPQGSFQLNPSPLTAPLAPFPEPSHLPFLQSGLNMVPSVPKASLPNTAQLLSLLNSNSSARSPSTFVADPIRPNFPTGSPVAPSH